eukprot:145580-Heterocapsa_arctica.AAC.1
MGFRVRGQYPRHAAAQRTDLGSQDRRIQVRTFRCTWAHRLPFNTVKQNDHTGGYVPHGRETPVCLREWRRTSVTEI